MNTVINLPLVPNLTKVSPQNIFKAKKLYLKTMKNGTSYYYFKKPKNDEYFLVKVEDELSFVNEAYLDNQKNIESFELIYDFELSKTYFYSLDMRMNNNSNGFSHFINIGNENRKFSLPIEVLNLFHDFFETVKNKVTFEVNLYIKFDNYEKKAIIILKDTQTVLESITEKVDRKFNELYKDVAVEDLLPGCNYIIKSKKTLTSNNYYEVNATFLKKSNENYFILTYENDEAFLIPNTQNKEGHLFELTSGFKIIIDTNFSFSRFMTNLCQEINLPFTNSYDNDELQLSKIEKTPFFNALQLCDHINANEIKYIENYQFSLGPLLKFQHIFNELFFIHRINDRQIIYKIQASKCSYFFKYQKKYHRPHLQFATPVGEAIFKHGEIAKIILFTDEFNLKELEWNPFPSLYELFNTINNTTLHGLSFIEENSVELNALVQHGKKILQNNAKKVIHLLKDDLLRLHKKELLFFN